MTFLQFDLILLKEKGELLEKCNIGVQQPPSYYVEPYYYSNLSTTLSLDRKDISCYKTIIDRKALKTVIITEIIIYHKLTL